ncbi:glycyl-radical enzyme activating protein [Pseudoramibacter faecis]|uniref:glycyl-radical enzyme activating protein n=1 Tax=Pseudoramibacter faecis TaxID=3108534 RepID=UPI002E773609|nr:glycyl-radical enzyme activating protein [Pseudoramibacter sp. HA2172]
MKSEATTGTVLRIERISPDDGMGLRTVIFLKGCPLRCAWCSTPESHKREPEWYYMQSKCRRCGHCIAACPNGALAFSADGSAIVRDQSRCHNCFRCADACIPHAIDIFGKTMSVDDIMREVQKDRLFYFYSGGGVTLSGGDVLLQADFAEAILKACKESLIDTTAELDLYGDYANLARLLPLLDSYFADLKHMDDAAHQKWTGVSNKTILANARRAGEAFPDTPMHARVPFIPGVNDTEENIVATAEFCREIPNCRSLEFLPYHRLGTAKYRYLGRPCPFEHITPLTVEATEEQVAILKARDWPFEIKIAGKVMFPPAH